LSEETTILIGAAVILFFIWRFTRTYQLYRFSLKVLTEHIERAPFKPSVSTDFFNEVLLGNRSVEPKSFFIRAFVFVVIALVLLPFKDYAPDLYWIVLVLIILYVPWCAIFGVLLKREVVKQNKRSVME
jgi:hypothetical protein